MNSIKKKYFLDNIDNNSVYRKIESELELKYGNSKFKINCEKSTLVIEFNQEENLLDQENSLIKIIKSISKEIDIVEREMKPTFKKVLVLENLDCANCAAKIERIAKRTFDYEFIVVDFASTRFIIETSSEELITNLVDEVQEIASQVDADIKVIDNAKANKEFNGVKIEKSRKIYFLIGIIFFAIGFILKSFINKYGFWDGLPKYLIIYLTYVPGYFFIGGDVLYGALKNIKSGRVFDEKFLMSLATITALGVGYYDEAIFVMVFYKVGELLQQYAVNYSRKSIASLIDIKPQVANILVNELLTEVDPSEVMIGDTLVVRPGEKIPLDGVVIKGEASLDISALTGESILQDVKEGSTVLSGSINVDGNLYIEATKLYEDSMVAKILDMVENASSLKSKSENFISKFAKYYTPTVVIVAVLLAVILPFILPNYDLTWNNGFKNSIGTALIFLVVSCPCALVISIPLGFFGGIGGASRRGILVKGSNYLEALNFVDTFVFDKTGTLTTGEFVVSEIISFEKYSSNEILKIAAHAEVNSSHLIAKSILEAYGVNNIDYSIISNERQQSNLGISAVVANMDVKVGRSDYLRAYNISAEEVDKSGIIVYVAIDNICEGYLVIFDRPKSDSKQAIKKLKEAGIRRTVMLTGDKESIARKVAEEIGIDEYFYEMNPIDKVEKFSQLKSRLDNDKKIAYVGDGINDAPVLSRADIGVAMGSLGSDAAIEVADIVLMTDDLNKLSEAIKIAKKTRKIVIQNVVLALAVKFSVLALALIEPFIARTSFSFLLDFLIYEAIFADVGVSLIAILNSLRAMKVEK
ncbi:MAG: heavy metal translocating P-type ATPase [Bacilli bacterium]